MKKIFCLLICAVIITLISFFSGCADAKKDILSGTNWVYDENANEASGMYFQEDGHARIWSMLLSDSGHCEQLYDSDEFVIEYSINGSTLTLHDLNTADGIISMEYIFEITDDSLSLEYDGQRGTYSKVDTTPLEYAKSLGLHPGA